MTRKRTFVRCLFGLLLLASCQPQEPRYKLISAGKEMFLVRTDQQTGKTWVLLLVDSNTWTEIKEPFPLPR